MSGDTVTGKALQFTNDNLNCYAYSGSITTAGTTELTIINYDTTSVYVNAKVTPYYIDNSGNDILWLMKVNDITIAASLLTSASFPDSERSIIIPPNVNFKITVQNLSGGSAQCGVALIGKVGMPQRVGNLDE